MDNYSAEHCTNVKTSFVKAQLFFYKRVDNSDTDNHIITVCLYQTKFYKKKINNPATNRNKNLNFRRTVWLSYGNTVLYIYTTY